MMDASANGDDLIRRSPTSSGELTTSMDLVSSCLSGVPTPTAFTAFPPKITRRAGELKSRTTTHEVYLVIAVTAVVIPLSLAIITESTDWLWWTLAAFEFAVAGVYAGQAKRFFRELTADDEVSPGEQDGKAGDGSARTATEH